MSNASTTAVGVILTLHDGTEYRMTPLTDEDMDELSEWCQSRIINMVDRSIPTHYSKEQRQERLQLAIREASTVSWTSPQGARMLGSIDGLTQLCLMGIRKNHPNIDVKELKQKLRDPRNAAKFNEMWKKANNVVVRDKKGVSPKTRQARKKFTKPLRSDTGGAPKPLKR